MAKLIDTFVVAALVAGAAMAEDGFVVGSDTGKYHLHLNPDVHELKLGEMHSWSLLVHDADGMTVDGATVTVDGGMPAHGHGLPTAPKVVDGDGPGFYRIEGLRFNMPGNWELRLRIDGAPGADTAVLEFEL